MALNDIVAGTYAGVGNLVGVPVSAEAVRDYLNYRKDLPKDSKTNFRRKLEKITVTGAFLAALSGCPTGVEPKPIDNGNGQEQPAPIEIAVSGLAGKANDQYVDVKPDKNYLDFDINVENGSLADVYWRQGSVFGTGSYSNGRFTFDNLPDTGYFDVLVDATNNGDVETKKVCGLLSGPERAYFIGDENEFNSEFGSLDDALQSGVFGGNVGIEYTQNDIDTMFAGLPFINYVKDSSEFRVGKDSNGDAYVITELPDVFKIFGISSAEYNTIDANDPYNL